MEPNDEKLLRSKITEAEKNHTHWNRDKVLSGLNFSPAPKKRRPIFWYYTAAATVLLVFVIQLFNTDYSTPIYQARNSKNVTKTDTTLSKSIDPIEIEPQLTQIDNLTPIQSKKAKTIKNTSPTIKPALPPAPNPVLVASLENTKVPNEIEEIILPVKKKIAPIIGVVYEIQKPIEKQKKLPLQIEFGKQNSEQTLAYTANQAILQTTLN